MSSFESELEPLVSADAPTLTGVHGDEIVLVTSNLSVKNLN